MSSESEPSWSNLMPAFPTFGTEGHELGYYYDLAHYLIIIPLVVLGVFAIGYNVLVAFATRWMYRNAWKKKVEQTDSDGTPVMPNTSVWEEIYVVNLKVARFLLGENVALTEQNGYLALQVHDYNVYMPLAMVYIQISELAVAMTIVVIFVDYLILQVTHTCISGVDCFFTANLSNQPLDCESLDTKHNNSLTCFHLSFNPIISAAITGGFLKLTPHILFATVTYVYFSKLNTVKRFLHFSTTKKNAVVQFVVSAILVTGFVGVGLMALFVVVFVPSIHVVTFYTANPMHQMTIIFCFVMYFLMTGFLWCLYPETRTPTRFLTAAWKTNIITSSDGHQPINEEKGKKLRPWVVVDPSLSTTEHDSLLND